jgi:hypothetical protein
MNQNCNNKLIWIVVIAGIVIITPILFVTLYPLPYILFGITNWDDHQPHTVHVSVANARTSVNLSDEIIVIGPGQRIERGIPPWKNDRDLDFTVTLEDTVTSRFTLNLRQGMRSQIDLHDPDANSLISPCILNYNSGVYDDGNPHPVFEIVNPDRTRMHAVSIFVGWDNNQSLFGNTYELMPEQRVNSPIITTLSSKEYYFNVTVDNNRTSYFKQWIGPNSPTRSINITNPEIDSREVMTMDYAARYWHGKCSG